MRTELKCPHCGESVSGCDVDGMLADLDPRDGGCCNVSIDVDCDECCESYVISACVGPIDVRTHVEDDE
jgi:hypothetical protein